MRYDFSVDGVRCRAEFVCVRTLGEFRGWRKISGANFCAGLLEPMSSWAGIEGRFHAETFSVLKCVVAFPSRRLGCLGGIIAIEESTLCHWCGNQMKTDSLFV